MYLLLGTERRRLIGPLGREAEMASMFTWKKRVKQWKL